ncbi:MAG: glycoside hydrolase family 43 protein [Acidimicrobiales bacterium]
MTDPVVLVDQPHPDPLPEPRPPSRPRRWRLPAAVVALVVALVAVALVATRGGGGESVATSVPAKLPALGPATDVYNGDLGDPFVLPVDTGGPGGKVSGYVAFGTGDWPARIPTARSTDLTSWQRGPDALPDLPSWSPPDPKNSLSWAPAALQVAHGFVLYVSLPDAASGQECIAAATSTAAEGPYTVVGDGPLLCQHDQGGSIDPAIVRDRSGTLHLLWKNDGNALNVPVSLWEQQLTPDGQGLRGVAHRLLTASEQWQGGIVEEPAVVPASGGGWWLFYSGNYFDRPEYATGLAWCPTLDGPCTEARQEPFFATAQLNQAAQFAPGGMETFRDASGDLWAVFDTWNRPTRNGRFYCCRSVQMARILST